MNLITRYVQNMTMYQLMMYFMLGLLGAAAALSLFGVLPYSVWGILVQTVVFVGLCKIVNTGIARALNIQPNVESPIITGLILSAIAGPLTLSQEWPVFLVMSVCAMASKYVFVWKKSHIFNPAAFGVVASSLILGYSASWWIGSQTMLPFLILGGVLMMQSIRRWHLVGSFLGVYLGLLALDAVLVRGVDVQAAVGTLVSVITSSSLVFFAFVMLIEPLTSPQTRLRRIWFGVVAGVILFALQRFVSSVPYSLELSLLLANVFSRIVSPDFRQAFILRKKEFSDSAIGNFWFEPTRPFLFIPGQFLEYTFSHPHPDNRGIRRFYTIASSPTEQEILLATKLSEPGSTFKKHLRTMEENDEITASKVSGDFILPSDPMKKIACIAGGIGITPFRSITKYLIDTKASRDIILLYGAREEKELVFQDIFSQAHEVFGMKTAYVIGQQIDESVIRKEIPDYAERLFYISGPEPMVQGISKLLVGMKIPRKHIKRDFFPGYQDEK